MSVSPQILWKHPFLNMNLTWQHWSGLQHLMIQDRKFPMFVSIPKFSHSSLKSEIIEKILQPHPPLPSAHVVSKTCPLACMLACEKFSFTLHTVVLVWSYRINFLIVLPLYCIISYINHNLPVSLPFLTERQWVGQVNKFRLSRMSSDRRKSIFYSNRMDTLSNNIIWILHRI